MKPKLLIVENNNLIRHDLQGLFSQPQNLSDQNRTIAFHVDAARTGAEAQAFLDGAAASVPYDVILLDLYLPETDAPNASERLEVGQRLISNLSNKVCAAVVFMSAYSDAQTMATLIQSIAIDFIFKPFKSENDVYSRVIHAY